MFNDPAELLSYLDRVHTRTSRLLSLIREEDIDWSPAPGWFTVGALVRHIAGTERWMWAETVALRPSRFPGHGPELADGLAATVAYYHQLHADAREIFASLTTHDLARDVETPGGAKMACWKWLRAMIEHEAHHRGQLYLMLAMRGIATPPIFGLTAEQVQSHSLPLPAQ